MKSSTVPENPALGPALRKICQRMSKTRANALTLFAQQYLASAPSVELEAQGPDMVAAAIEEAWQFIQQRDSLRAKISFDVQGGDSGKLTGTRIYTLLDDMPFLVDSLRQAVNRCGVNIRVVNNAVLAVKRSKPGSKSKNSRTGVLDRLAPSPLPGYQTEALCCIHVGVIGDEQQKLLEAELRDTLKNVRAAVKDYRSMCETALAVKESLLRNARNLPVSQEELNESLEFIDWLVDNHFTFLGYERYQLRGGKRGQVIHLEEGSRLGISRYKTDLKKRMPLANLPKGAAAMITKQKICSFAKSGNRSKVHRPAYYDYVLLREFGEKGEVVTEHRFVGLYTSSVYFQAARVIPLVRKKVAAVLDQSGFAPNGHSAKDLLQVINIFPRDELFQTSTEQLLSTSMEITRIQETRATKLFIRKDDYGKFFSCLIYVPRDIYNTRVRQTVQTYLMDRLGGAEVDFNTYFSESILARIHFIIRSPSIHQLEFDRVSMEKEIMALIKPWEDYFLESLRAEFPDRQADELFAVYSNCYSAAYKEAYSAAEGVKDISRIALAVREKRLALDLEPHETEAGAELSFKIFSHGQRLLLSDVGPLLENLGLVVVGEKSFKLQPSGFDVVWLHDFAVARKRSEIALDDHFAANFEQGFDAIISGKVDNDSFNGLIVAAGLACRDAALLRAVGAYLKQIKFSYTPDYIAETLSLYTKVAGLLVHYFYARFDPSAQGKANPAGRLRNQLHREIDKAANLAEDSVMRGMLAVIDAMLRTNFFQQDEHGEHKDYMAFKLAPQKIPFLPKPRPQFEIFVFSAQVEGVHLRGGPVARGGLRWSDRSEDYRTEILGLVKAQQVKNSVIVPVGAKGGFIVKRSPPSSDREAFMNAGVASYRTFISALLDVTDNLANGKVLPPPQTVRLDKDDPYLVVAADKGTATFSDIANGIAKQYGFWLGDGFASGGSNGYDHKAMGITARGAWVSVQRHFRELGIDVQNQDFIVVGIGDMSGDVFGNGMLLSRHIQLCAAFNHLHIFIDPNPDAAASFKERKRLFHMPRSAWADYDPDLISKGGGVFERTAKSIAVTPEMKARFEISEDKVTPDQLISLLLKSPVDLLWNGGIGTYVKSRAESHAEVGDRTNDGLRVNADELRCRVIGEGGNLGMTQKARIEYGINGGVSLTDFIDNSAGVDCSDHEVNIKILLNSLTGKQRLTEAKRSKLLRDMTSEVAELVLDNNYRQVQSIGVASAVMESRGREYAGLIGYLEKNAGLDRDLENLPAQDLLEERLTKGEYLTRPELSVLTSYMKMHLKKELVSASYIDEDYLLPYLHEAFPRRLAQSYSSQMKQHRLRREIIATQLANNLVNLFGPSFFYRMIDATGSMSSEVVKAAVIAKDIYKIDEIWSEIEALDYQISAQTQSEMMFQLIRMVRRATRWLLRNRRASLDLVKTSKEFSAGLQSARTMVPRQLPEELRAVFERKKTALQEQSVPEALACKVASCQFLVPVISFIGIANSTGRKLGSVFDVYYGVGELLRLNWLGEVINSLDTANYWEALARESFLDDLAWQQRTLTCNVINTSSKQSTASNLVALWAERHPDPIRRAEAMLSSLQAEPRPDYSMLSVALRELLNLAQSTGGGKAA